MYPAGLFAQVLGKIGDVDTMSFNKIMLTVLKALSCAEIDVKKNYRVDRMLENIIHHVPKQFYEKWDEDIAVDGYKLPVRLFSPKQLRSQEIIFFFMVEDGYREISKLIQSRVPNYPSIQGGGSCRWITVSPPNIPSLAR